ncbi:hypothetical protein DRO35_04340 [Candidatus Bathyarchaeota archaeon]|nr:MAG: hypothetical protein DRO35_04340 [Candidatus Bathyarchaeota archaeon]
MTRIREWLSFKERRLEKYEEAKKEFIKAIGRPVIMIPLELPKSLMFLKEEFYALENDEEFIRRMQRSCVRYLKRRFALKIAEYEKKQKK